MIKAVKVLNTFSMLLFAAILLMVYAYLPINVDMNVTGMGGMHKQSFFYNAIVLFLVFSILLRLIITVGLKRLPSMIHAWVSALIFILNFYLTTLIGFIGVWNNAASITPSDYSYLNYMGPVLLIFWLVGLIFLVIKNR